MPSEQLSIRRHHPKHRIRKYRQRSQRRQSIHFRFGVIQGTVEFVGEVTVRGGRDEGDARIQYLAAVKRDLPLPDQDWVGGNEPGGEGEEGYAEDATCEPTLEMLESGGYLCLC